MLFLTHRIVMQNSYTSETIFRSWDSLQNAILGLQTYQERSPFVEEGFLGPRCILQFPFHRFQFVPIIWPFRRR